MAGKEYLPLILFTAILSTLCTFARDIIDYQQIVLCIQVQRASALRLHPSAPYLHPSARVSTATIPHTPHDKNWRASRTLRHRGSGFSVRATDFSTSLHVFSDWHKWYDAPGTSTSADGCADKIRLCLHYFSHWYSEHYKALVQSADSFAKDHYIRTVYTICTDTTAHDSKIFFLS